MTPVDVFWVVSDRAARGRPVWAASVQASTLEGKLEASQQHATAYFARVWIFWGESKALFLHLTNRCREN